MQVAVVGAGIAGLTFAAAMRKYAPAAEVTLYERDASPAARPEGYSLGLRGDAGLLVLKRLGLYEQVSADAVVAADGVGSAVRAQMIGDPRRYLGLTSIVGDAPIVPRHELVEGGYFMTLGDDGTSVFCYRQGGSVHLSYTVHVDAESQVAGRL